MMIKSQILFYFFIINLFLMALLGASPQETRNLTGKFEKILKANKDGLLNPAQIAILKNEYKILFIPGFMANPMKKIGLVNIFADQENWLKNHLGFSSGTHYDTIPVNTQDTAAENTHIIKEAINKPSRPVIIVGHSKGGMEALRTLLENKELQNKVAGLLTIQSPFKGTPIADKVCKNALAAWGMALTLHMGGGSLKAIYELTTLQSKDYFKKALENKSLSQLIQKVPILNVASWTGENCQGRTKSILSALPFIGSSFTKDEINDGVVGVESALIGPSCVDHIILEGADHVDAVAANLPLFSSIKTIDRVAFFKTSLGMLLHKIQLKKYAQLLQFMRSLLRYKAIKKYRNNLYIFNS